MRISLLVLCLCFSFSMDAQKRKEKREARAQQKAEFATLAVLSQLGKTLYSYEVAATSENKTTSAYEWRFVLAEESMRGKVDKNIAADLTGFLFSFTPATNNYDGKVVQSSDEINDGRVLSMVYQYLTQNIRYYRGDLDFVKLNGKYYYVLYYPYNKEAVSKS